MDVPALRADLIAGLTVAAMLVPQAMAYALLAGLPPTVGLAASGLPLLAHAIAGHSPRVAMGPAAIDSLLTAAALQTLDLPADQKVMAAALLAALIGTLHVIAAGVGFGRAARHVSGPALAGFTTGAAILIGLSQVKDLTGAPVESAATGPGRVLNTLTVIDQIDPSTLVVAAGSIALILALRSHGRVPAALGTVVAMTGVSFLLGSPSPTVGTVPTAWPTVTAPNIDLALIVDLVPMAALIAIVGFMETLAVCSDCNAAATDEDATNPRRELFGLGIANLTAGLSAGMPVTAGLSRSAVNTQAGARTRRSGAVTALAVIITAGLLTPLVSTLPRATLAAIILVAVTGMIDWPAALGRLADRHQIMFTLTAVTTVIFGATTGIAAVITLSLGTWITVRASNRLQASRSSHNVRTFGVTGVASADDDHQRIVVGSNGSPTPSPSHPHES